jgi:hypothetical protein
VGVGAPLRHHLEGKVMERQGHKEACIPTGGSDVAVESGEDGGLGASPCVR